MMFKCSAGHTLTPEVRNAPLGAFKTLVCHTCEREAYIAAFTRKDGK